MKHQRGTVFILKNRPPKKTPLKNRPLFLASKSKRDFFGGQGLKIKNAPKNHLKTALCKTFVKCPPNHPLFTDRFSDPIVLTYFLYLKLQAYLSIILY